MSRDDVLSITSDPVFIDAIKAMVRDVLVRELQNSFLLPKSIHPSKIKPVDLDGLEPADLSPLYYDATNDVVTF